MGAVHFPSLINRRLEQGLWFLGCNNLEPQWLDGRLSPELLRRLVPHGYDSSRYYRGHRHFQQMQHRAWTEEECLEHTKTCYHPTIHLPTGRGDPWDRLKQLDAAIKSDRLKEVRNSSFTEQLLSVMGGFDWRRIRLLPHLAFTDLTVGN
jgi:hypothetical protein